MEHSQRCGVSSSTLKLLLALPLSFLCFSYSQCSIFNILLFFHSLFFSYIYFFLSLSLSIYLFFWVPETSTCSNWSEFYLHQNVSAILQRLWRRQELIHDCVPVQDGVSNQTPGALWNLGGILEVPGMKQFQIDTKVESKAKDSAKDPWEYHSCRLIMGTEMFS